MKKIEKDGFVLELPDELLDQVSGGETTMECTCSGYMPCTCGYTGPHPAKVVFFDAQGDFTPYEVTIRCGKCGKILEQG